MSNMNDKTKGVIAYIFGLISGLIMLLVKENSRVVKIHGAQAVTIWGLYFLIRIAYRFIPVSIPGFSYILYGCYFVLIIMGIMKAYNEQEPELPVIGDIAKSIFNKQIEEGTSSNNVVNSNENNNNENNNE